MKLIEYDPAKIKFMAKFPRYEPYFQDHSRMIILDDCARKYFYRMVLGRTPKVNIYQVVLEFGTAYHKFRELLETKDYDTAIRYVLGVTLPKPPQGNKFEYLNELRLLKTCQFAYNYWQAEKKNGRIKVIAIEQPFNVQVAEGISISGRADQIVEWNGKLWGRDFKTTSKDEAAFSKRLDPNDQCIRYIVGESKLHGQQIQGIIFEAAYNTKTQGPKIYSVLQSRVKWQIDQFEKEMILKNKILETYRAEDTWPMQMHNCAWCTYARVCRKTSEESMMAELQTQFNLSPWDHTKTEQTDMED
jgi:hypothetical protein